MSKPVFLFIKLRKHFPTTTSSCGKTTNNYSAITSSVVTALICPSNQISSYTSK